MADGEDFNFPTNGNGHGDVADIAENMMTREATLTLEKRGDGNILGAMSDQQLGVMQKMATAPQKNDEYRQVLLFARFMSIDRAKKAVAAIAWCHRYHGDMTPIVDSILAECAVKGGRVSELIDALTHMRITSNTSGKPNANGNKNGSPLR